MIKSDSHMERIRVRLLDETAGIKKSEDKRREREGKKFGKQVQVEKLKEREKSKKEMEERLKGLKRSMCFRNSSIVAKFTLFLQRERTSWIIPKPLVVEMTLIFRSKTLSQIVLLNGAVLRTAEGSPVMLATRSTDSVAPHDTQNLIPGNLPTTLALELAEEEVVEVSAVEEGVVGVEPAEEVAEVAVAVAEVAVLDHQEEGTGADAVALKDWANQDDRSSLLFFTLLVCQFAINTTTRHPVFLRNTKTYHLQVIQFTITRGQVHCP